jgi:hypothetical protein
MTAIQCPSVQRGSIALSHEPCDGARCRSWWRDGRCTAADTVPAGRLRRRLPCAIESVFRWALQARPGLCPPMRHGDVCEHQGGEFSALDESYVDSLRGGER